MVLGYLNNTKLYILRDVGKSDHVLKTHCLELIDDKGFNADVRVNCD